MDGVNFYKRKKQKEQKEDKKDEILRLTDEIIAMRNSSEIVKHPDFVTWYQVNIGNKLETELKILKTTRDHAEMLRAQGAVKVLEGLTYWHENINKNIDKHRKRIDQLQKDIDHE